MFAASSPEVANFWQTPKNLPEVYPKHFFFLWFFFLLHELAKALPEIRLIQFHIHIQHKFKTVNYNELLL